MTRAHPMLPAALDAAWADYAQRLGAEAIPRLADTQSMPPGYVAVLPDGVVSP